MVKEKNELGEIDLSVLIANIYQSMQVEFGFIARCLVISGLVS